MKSKLDPEWTSGCKADVAILMYTLPCSWCRSDPATSAHHCLHPEAAGREGRRAGGDTGPRTQETDQGTAHCTYGVTFNPDYVSGVSVYVYFLHCDSTMSDRDLDSVGNGIQIWSFIATIEIQ